MCYGVLIPSKNIREKKYERIRKKRDPFFWLVFFLFLFSLVQGWMCAFISNAKEEKGGRRGRFCIGKNSNAKGEEEIKVHT